MTLERFEFDRQGYQAILRSPGTEAMLDGKAQRVKAAAEAMLTGDGTDEVYLLADTSPSRSRAGATVIGVPMRLEVDERILGRAIDAAG